MKCKASSLLYSLFILLIVGALLTIVIFLFGISKKNVFKFVLKSQEVYDIQSGFNILMSSSSIIPLESTKELDLFDDGLSIVLLERYQWGLMEIIGSSVQDSVNSNKKYALIAETVTTEQKFYLVDNNTPLSLAGKTELYGICVLPKKGVERAYLANSNYEGTQLIYGTKELSSTTMPDIDKEFKLKLTNIFNQKLGIKDSLVNEKTLSYGDSISNSFHNKTIVIKSSNGIMIPEMMLKGNIKIISDKEIYVSAGTQLDGVILIAPYIEIANDFEGNCQLFSTDSIKIGNNVKMDYLSALTIYQKEAPTLTHSKLTIGENFSFSGIIVGHQELYNYKNPVQVIFNENSEFTGSIFCNGDVQLKGMFKGEFIVNKLTLVKPGSTYVNHLENVVINKESIHKNYAILSVGKTENRIKKVIVWLN